MIKTVMKVQNQKFWKITIEQERRRALGHSYLLPEHNAWPKGSRVGVVSIIKEDKYPSYDVMRRWVLDYQ